MKRLIGFAAALLAVSAFAGTASARSAATLTVTPGDVVFTDSNVYETFSGCGYRPSAGATIVVHTPTADSFFGGPSDPAGCISITANGFITSTGLYRAEAWQDGPANGAARIMATASFVVS